MLVRLPVAAEYGALLIVDAVASFGGMRCDFTSWQADLAVVAPQKCLGGSPPRSEPNAGCARGVCGPALWRTRAFEQ